MNNTGVQAILEPVRDGQALRDVNSFGPRLRHARRVKNRILAARKNRSLRYEDLVRIGAMMKKAKDFVSLPGWTPGAMTDNANLRARFAPPPEQLTLP